MVLATTTRSALRAESQHSFDAVESLGEDLGGNQMYLVAVVCRHVSDRGSEPRARYKSPCECGASEPVCNRQVRT